MLVAPLGPPLGILCVVFLSVFMSVTWAAVQCTSDRVNIRSGPSTTAAILLTSNRGDAFQILASEFRSPYTWVSVVVCRTGQRGWMVNSWMAPCASIGSSDRCDAAVTAATTSKTTATTTTTTRTTTKATTSTPRPTSTSATRQSPTTKSSGRTVCASAKINLRQDPSTHFPAVGQALIGQRFSILEERVANGFTWANVRVCGSSQTAWMINSFFASCPDDMCPEGGLSTSTSHATTFPPALPGSSVSPNDYMLPFPLGASYYVTQGRQGVSHWNKMEWAVDFGMPEGAEVTACHQGTVRLVKSDATGSCGGKEFANDVNYVVLSHDTDGHETQYLHLSQVNVKVGDRVSQGQVIGKAGKTGWTNCNSHLHWQRQVPCSSYFCQSVSTVFSNVDPTNEPMPLGYNKLDHKVTNRAAGSATGRSANAADPSAGQGFEPWSLGLIGAAVGVVAVIVVVAVLIVYVRGQQQRRPDDYYEAIDPTERSSARRSKVVTASPGLSSRKNRISQVL